jgi:hypothetical protein
MGVLTAVCSKLRAENLVPDRPGQSICIYDSAVRRNPAHAEFGWSALEENEEPGDANERRKLLFDIFGNVATTPTQYRNGSITAMLPAQVINQVGPRQV